MAGRNENRFFAVSPRIVRADSEVEVTIRPLFDHSRFQEDTEYEVSLYPLEELPGQTGEYDHPFSSRLTPVDGILRVRAFFAGEQEHLLYVEAVRGEEKVPVGDFRVYSLADDLYQRRPYKGDTHMHSCRSDGREAPAYLAAASRRIGLDFMAVTDHHKYAPSLEAIAAFADAPIDLRIFPGEEIHQQPYSPVHIVNFGGSFSVNALIEAQTPYLDEVQAIEEMLADVPMRPERRYQYAQCLWTYRKIREAGGLAIFCHPYWFECHWYNVPDALITRHFTEQPFDAYELIGGFFRHEVESNMLQVARYHEERANGRQFPIVGASDAHGCERGELFGWYYTIVFSHSLDFTDLCDSIKAQYSVAVEALPDEAPRAHGPFRLVKYAHFLLREVFPQHDDMCGEEGRLMQAYLAGDPEANTHLAACQGRCGRALEENWLGE